MKKTKLKIVLVNPNEMNPHQTHHSDFKTTLLKYIGPSMTFPALVSKMDLNKYEIKIIDYFSLYLSIDSKSLNRELSLYEYAKTILVDADIVGIYCMTSTQRFSFEYAKLAKKISANSIVIFGGPHTIMDATFLINQKYIDYIVIDRGDTIFPTLISSIEKNEKINKRIWQDSNISFENMSIPNYDIYFSNDKNNEIETASIFTSKGCVEACKFCSRNNLKKNIRYKPISLVIDELKYFKEKNIKRIRIDDDNFAQDADYATELFKKMKKEKLYFDMSIITRADTITKDLMNAYVDIGGKSVIIAIETGSESLRKKMGKNLLDKQIYDTIAILKQYKLSIYLYIMLGFPNENDEDLSKTMQMIEKIEPSGVSASIFHMHPGMPIYKKLSKEKNIPKDYFVNNGAILNYIEGDNLKKIKIFQKKLHDNYGFSRSGFWKQDKRHY